MTAPELLSFDELYRRARSVLNPRRLSRFCEVGTVAAALLTDRGNVYLGVCVVTACSMGFCAEHAAAGAMITAGESRVVRVVAVGPQGQVLPPCGRCREFLSQIDDRNLDAEILVDHGVAVRLRDLLPYDWRARRYPDEPFPGNGSGTGSGAGAPGAGAGPGSGDEARLA